MNDCAGSATGEIREGVLTEAAALLPCDEAFAGRDRMLDLLAGSDDAREGAAAIIERRPPTWTGRRPVGLDGR